jgi:hypothetical protein
MNRCCSAFSNGQFQASTCHFGVGSRGQRNSWRLGASGLKASERLPGCGPAPAALLSGGQ